MDAPISQLIHQAEAGDSVAAGQVFATLYRELHSIAERELHRGGSELTLGTTTLLHEAYLNIEFQITSVDGDVVSPQDDRSAEELAQLARSTL